MCLTLRPDFHFLEVAYPYVARRLLTDEDPALRQRLVQVWMCLCLSVCVRDSNGAERRGQRPGGKGSLGVRDDSCTGCTLLQAFI